MFNVLFFCLSFRLPALAVRLLFVSRYWGCWFEAFVGCLDYELTCSGAEDTSGGGSGGSSGSGSGGSSSSVPGDVVVEEAATEGSGAAGRAVAPSQTHAVAVASGLAGILAASALLLL